MEKIKRFCRENARILLALGAVLAFCAVLPVMFAATAVPTGSWGLSFRTEGQYDAVYVGDTEEKVIYLTFDAGYEAGYTEQILDVLKKHDVKAAFFVVGTYIENNPELVRRMAEEGHIVGNHTWHHYNMSQIADLQSFTRELQSVADQYREATGEEMLPYYRPPQGVYSEENLKMAKSLGYRTVFWSLAYVDWNRDAQPTPEQAYEKLLPRIHPGAVVLLHSKFWTICSRSGRTWVTASGRSTSCSTRPSHHFGRTAYHGMSERRNATLFFRRFRYVLQ